MNLQQIFESFSFDDRQEAQIENHVKLIKAYGIFLDNVRKGVLDGEEVLTLLIQRAKIQDKEFAVNDPVFEEPEEDVLITFIWFFDRLIERPVYKYEWREFKQLLNYYENYGK